VARYGKSGNAWREKGMKEDRERNLEGLKADNVWNKSTNASTSSQ